MNKNERIEQYNDLLGRLNALQLALTTVEYDDQTVGPKDGRDYRGTMVSILAGEYFKLLQSDSTFALLEELAAYDDLDEILMKSVAELLKQLKKERNVPAAEYIAFNKLLSDSNAVWEEAREQDDYSAFEPLLAQVIASQKKMIAYRQDGKPTYDSMLNDYEEGLDQTKVDAFFKIVNDRLVPFIAKISALNITKPEFLTQKVSREKQMQITQLLMKYLKFESSFGQQGESAHPFSTNMSINDVRITTHYYENNFTSNLFSIIHETGHATYNHQVNPAFEGTPLANNMSYAMHESQSRLMENMLGRTKAFWTTLYAPLQAIIPEVLGPVSLDEFIHGINYVQPSLVRTEADELTYPLHILIRYNIERDLFTDTITTKGLDERWADEYERVLGVRPANKAQGVLQDVHWSQASFGYFPTYALGSAYAAQFMKTMREQIDVDQALANNKIEIIKEWLRVNIHQYSGTLTAEEILTKVSGHGFDANIYCDYLIDKYSTLYGLK